MIFGVLIFFSFSVSSSISYILQSKGVHLNPLEETKRYLQRGSKNIEWSLAHSSNDLKSLGEYLLKERDDSIWLMLFKINSFYSV